MSLTPVFKSADPEFNYEFAKQVYDAVMEMDDDTAEEFVAHVVSNYAEDLVAKNQRAYQSTLDRVMVTQERVMKRALMNAADKDAEAVLPYAKALSEISKAGWDKDPDWVKRDRGGRFATRVDHPSGKVKPADKRTAAAYGIRGLKGKHGPTELEYKNLNSKQQAHYQAEYMQISNFLKTLRTQGNPGDHRVMLHMQGLDDDGNPTSETWTTPLQGTKVPVEELLDSSQQVVGVEARPETLTTGGAAFSVTQALGRSPQYGDTRRIAAIDSVDRQGFGDFASTWNNEASQYNSNDQRYERLGAASELLGTGALPGSKRHLATKLGSLAGSHGAEAESVFGPSMRKTAYRYRGTEEPPEKHLVTLYDRAIMRQKMANLGDSPEGPINTGRRTQGSGKAGTPSATTQMAIQRVTAERRDPTWGERRAGRDVIAEQFRQFKLPSKKLYDLQLASGNTPPSEGVIMDKHGKIITQAVGYGDDHYLPFNLKNLKALRGGEYVRTRSVGGLTSEDIYTGLMSGARQVTVVSRSGTFTMQFDADFKGGRRYNDKAKRMTRRYEQIVDAVQSEQVQRRDVPTPIRQMITSKVKEDFPGEEGSYIREEVKRRITEYKKTPELTEEDDALINALYTRGMTQDGSRDADAYRKEVTNVVMQSKGFMFQLDSRGYADALKALEEQFPYYITTDAKVAETDSDIINLERDKGYVEPGRNRPTEARAGLYGTRTNPGRKVSASQADYQGNTQVRSRNLRAVPVTASGGGDDDGFDNPAADREGGSNPKTPPPSAGKQRRALREKSDAAASVMGDLKASGLVGSSFAASHPFTALPPAEFSSWIGSPANQKTFQEFIDRNIAPNEARLTPRAKASYDAYKAAASGEVQSKFSADKANTWGAKPYEFDGPAHRENADPKVVRQRMTNIEAQHMSLTNPNKLGAMNDQAMKAELDALEDIRATLKDDPSLRDRDNGEGRRRNAMDLFGSPTSTRLFLEPDENLVKRMQNIHEMRALKSKSDIRPESRRTVAGGEPYRATAEEPLSGHVIALDAMNTRMERTAKRLLEIQQGPDAGKHWTEARQQEYDLLNQIGQQIASGVPPTEEQADAYNIMLAELEIK